MAIRMADMLVSGNGKTPIAQAEDILMPNGTRLSEWKPESGGGVTSWNDLPDRPFGEVAGEPEFFGDYTWTFGDSGIPGVYGWGSTNVEFSLIEGEFYLVMWNGVGHNCTAVTATFDGVDCVGVGNLSIIGLGEDTHEPFLIGVAVDGSRAAAFTTENGATNTVSFIHATSAIKTLDAKYLPMDAIDARIEAKLAEIPDVSEVGM